MGAGEVCKNEEEEALVQRPQCQNQQWTGYGRREERNEKWQGLEPEWLSIYSQSPTGRGGGSPGVGGHDPTAHQSSSCKAGSPSTPNCPEPIASFIIHIETSVARGCSRLCRDALLKKMNYLYQGRQKRKHKQRITFQEVSDTLETDTTQ